MGSGFRASLIRQDRRSAGPAVSTRQIAAIIMCIMIMTKHDDGATTKGEGVVLRLSRVGRCSS